MRLTNLFVPIAYDQAHSDDEGDEAKGVTESRLGLDARSEADATLGFGTSSFVQNEAKSEVERSSSENVGIY
jgi:hypothetical protein